MELTPIFLDYPLRAQAILFRNFDNYPIGTIYFEQPNVEEGVWVQVNLHNIPDGGHGLHIHEKGDMSNGCESMGPHFNPFSTDHGGRIGPTRHPGDMGNVWSHNGKVIETFWVPMYLFNPNYYSIIGRSIVLHEDIDDLGRGNNTESRKTGSSGERYACGIIQLI